jgi:hypothetical protein
MSGFTGMLTTRTVAAFVAILASGCAGTGGGKDYDIGPLISLRTHRCTEDYDGDLTKKFPATCMVSKENCEKATADWHEEMKNLDDALEFRCD